MLRVGNGGLIVCSANFAHWLAGAGFSSLLVFVGRMSRTAALLFLPFSVRHSPPTSSRSSTISRALCRDMGRAHRRAIVL